MGARNGYRLDLAPTPESTWDQVVGLVAASRRLSAGSCRVCAVVDQIVKISRRSGGFSASSGRR
jgi:hypothetical protein